MTTCERLVSALLLLVAPVACGNKPDGKAQASSREAPSASGSVGPSGSAGAPDTTAAASAREAPPAPKVAPKLGAWIKNLGSKAPDGDAGNDYIDPEVGLDVAVDSEGNTIVTGRYRASADFGGGELKAVGGTDVVIAQYDKSGAHKWSKSFGGAETDTGAAVAVDADDNVYVVAKFNGSIDVGAGPYKAEGGGFLVKLDKRGNYLWSKPILEGRPAGVAVTPRGDVVVVGGAGEKATVFTEKLDGPVTFLVKLDAAGATQWVKTYRTTDGRIGVGVEGLAVHTDGSLYLLATPEKTVDFGGGPLTSAGSEDVAVVKLDANGGHVWSKLFGAQSRERAAGIGVDASGAVVFTGSFSTPVDFGGGPLVSNGGEDAFVVKLDASGAHAWSKRFGSRGQDDARGLAVDALGHVAVTGEFTGHGIFDGQSLESAGERDTFIALLDPGGAVVWSKRFGSSTSEWAGDVAIGGGGGVVATGAFHGKATYGDQTLATNGGNDLYLLSIPD
ncbi:MAG: hypothetical protein HY908_25495 [Myxococcales bacterium]|nr:hypothetical protein [Myxococcales bacterium]